MKIGYARISKADGSQSLEPQIDQLIAAGVEKKNIYTDQASGKKTDRPGLNACLKALRSKDVLVVWKLDRLGRSLKHLIDIVDNFNKENIGFVTLSGKGASINTTTPEGKLIFGIFAALSEFERELISERTKIGLKAARARGRLGGRKFQLSKSQIRLAQAAMAKRDTSVSELAQELGIQRQTIYKYVSPNGELRESALKVLYP